MEVYLFVSLNSHQDQHPPMVRQPAVIESRLYSVKSLIKVYKKSTQIKYVVEIWMVSAIRSV